MISISGAPGPEVVSLILVGFDPATSNLIFGSSDRINAAISPPYTITSQGPTSDFEASKLTLLATGPLPVNIQYTR
jgi:hypothetical protein